MEIILLHYTAQPIVGGVERVVGNHARLLSDHGHHVRIVAGRGAQIDPRVQFETVPLVDSLHPEILSLKADLDQGCVPNIFADLTGRLESVLAPIFTTADMVIAHNVCSLAKNLPLVAALYNLSLNPNFPKLIQWNHDIAWITPRYRPELHSGFPWDLLRVPWPDVGYVTVSEWRRNQLAKLMNMPLENIHMIPGGVDVQKLLNITSETYALAERVHFLDARPLLLLPVRLTRRKNIELALQVLACLRENSYPEANLVITGPPGAHNPTNQDYFQYLIQLTRELNLESSAHFLAQTNKAYLPDRVVADLFRLADALLLTSTEEGFGLPLLEAGITRLPIFCSDLPPLREIGNQEATYFSLEDTPDQIAKIIAQGLRNNAAFKLRSHIRRNNSWENIYHKISTELLSEPSHSVPPMPSYEISLDFQPVQSHSGLSRTPTQQSELYQNIQDWLQSNTFQSDQFSDLELLLRLKKHQNLTISLALPTLNVADTLDEIIRKTYSVFVEQVPLIDEVVLIDSGSTDETRAIATAYGLPVFIHQNILPALGSRTGKGEALWKSLYLTQGDILLWMDTDIQNFHPRFIYGMLGPLLTNANLQFIKGFYRRPLKVSDQILENAGGRVTELIARPLLNLYYPELSAIFQPLAGECAARRTLLEQLPFFSGYGVEIGLLLDIFTKFGLEAIAQVDLYRRVHNNKSLGELSKMSFAVLQAFMSRMKNKLGSGATEYMNRSLLLGCYLDEGLQLQMIDIYEQERPPMIELPEYRNRKKRS